MLAWLSSSLITASSSPSSVSKRPPLRRSSSNRGCCRPSQEPASAPRVACARSACADEAHRRQAEAVTGEASFAACTSRGRWRAQIVVAQKFSTSRAASATTGDSGCDHALGLVEAVRESGKGLADVGQVALAHDGVACRPAGRRLCTHLNGCARPGRRDTRRQPAVPGGRGGPCAVERAGWGARASAHEWRDRRKGPAQRMRRGDRPASPAVDRHGEPQQRGDGHRDVRSRKHRVQRERSPVWRSATAHQREHHHATAPIVTACSHARGAMPGRVGARAQAEGDDKPEVADMHAKNQRRPAHRHPRHPASRSAWATKAASATQCQWRRQPRQPRRSRSRRRSRARRARRRLRDAQAQPARAARSP